MSGLRQAAQEYLAMRRALGYKLATQGRILMSFAASMDAAGRELITTEAAVDWAAHPPHSTRPEWQVRRLEAVRLFARHLHALDPAHEIPAPGILPFRGYRRMGGHRYTEEETAALIAAAGRLRPCLRALTWQAFLGLLAVTGMRPREAYSLDDQDIDLAGSLLQIRTSKYNITRTLPLDPTASAELSAYMRNRDSLITRSSPALFVTGTGARLDHHVYDTFARLRKMAGLPAPAGARQPRLIDFRHTFAVTTLIDCIRDGGDVSRCLPLLSAWLGHGDPASTYWYLEADPELLGLAAGRLDLNQESPHDRPGTAYPELFHSTARTRARGRA
ncbi:MAG TPA: tyrosine-type recombinase/integrase [Streptosporangiaceae bacterium]|nr:tyrosine-type recombinase/integrase [Streptosporangiaceae bacterium]